jgi:hypothetical protein
MHVTTTNPNDLLPQSWWVMPVNAPSTTLSTKDLRAVLLYNNGRLAACGELWDIKSKSLGAGGYRVWIEKAEL